MTDLVPGKVVILKDFNLQNVGEGGKPVWMLYLGRDDIMQCEIFVYCHRFTSQVHHYSSDGDRPRDKAILYSAGQYGIFDTSCVLDFNEKPYQVEIKYFESSIDLERTDRLKPLPESEVRRIWNMLRKAPHYTKKQLIIIRDNLNRAGISGLNL